tara:strand:- start:4105 stop:4488 length:384 start_codon:yes stop_codon:yes gene_type:complete
MKKCNHCKKTLPFTDFYRTNRGDVNMPGGYMYICIPCDLRRKRLWRRNNPHYLAYEKKRQKPGSKHAKLSKKNSQRHRDEMSDMYMKGLIVKRDKNLSPNDVTQEMIDAARGRLLLRRKLRKKKKEK